MTLPETIVLKPSVQPRPTITGMELKALRVEAQMSWAELGRLIGVNKRTIQRWGRLGHTALPQRAAILLGAILRRESNTTEKPPAPISCRAVGLGSSHSECGRRKEGK